MWIFRIVFEGVFVGARRRVERIGLWVGDFRMAWVILLIIALIIMASCLGYSYFIRARLWFLRTRVCSYLQ